MRCAMAERLALACAHHGHARPGMQSCQPHVPDAEFCPPTTLPLAGAWAELELDTRAHDNSDKQDTLVWLSHLRSYKGMGTARVQCVSGCMCKPSKLDGTWQMRFSLFWFHRFQVSQAWRESRPWPAHLPALVAMPACPARSKTAPPPPLAASNAAPDAGAAACFAAWDNVQVSRHKRCRFRVTLTDEPGEFPEEGHKVRVGGDPAACSLGCHTTAKLSSSLSGARKSEP